MSLLARILIWLRVHIYIRVTGVHAFKAILAIVLGTCCSAMIIMLFLGSHPAYSFAIVVFGTIVIAFFCLRLVQHEPRERTALVLVRER